MIDTRPPAVPIYQSGFAERYGSTTYVLKRLLEKSRGFGPDAVTLLLKAYEGVVDELGLTDPAEKDRAARIVLALAEQEPDLDPDELRASTANALLHEARKSD